MVSFIQRLGSALNLNLHRPMRVPDGGWRLAKGKPHIQRAPVPSEADIERLLVRLIGRITRCWVRAGGWVMAGEASSLDVDSAEEDGRAGWAGAAVRDRIAVGPLAGPRTRRLRGPTLAGSLPSTPGALTASHEGFSLNGALAWGARERDTLERRCRYRASGPLSNERWFIDGDSLLVPELKRPLRDGTPQCLFEALDCLARLAAPIPRPRSPLIRYHGVFAPHARHRAGVLGRPRARTPSADEAPKAAAAMTWRLRRRCVDDGAYTTLASASARAAGGRSRGWR
ncbi:MAG: hypothetical protein GKR94_04690 [Gammaproteobacteria bacterium]|nr:hypothetical protein [Gammaproteobacteria bacterium]